jgi:DNA-binding transcriptional LysR family regulator
MLDSLTLDQLRVFVAVAEAGSFRAASKRLARVQSAVSHAISNLEAQLEVALFDRSQFRPQLSPEGAALLADVRALLLKVDAIRARARGLGEGVELGITVALDPQFPLPLIAAALHELCEPYPTVAFRLLSTPLGASVLALREGRCALAITAADIPDPGVELEALMTIGRAAVVAPSHPLAGIETKGGMLAATELADHIRIVAEDPSPLTEGRDFAVLSPVTWRVADNATKLALILGGIGWGSLPIWSIERELSEGRLVRVPAAFGASGETVLPAYLAHRTDRPLGPAARAFREALLRHARQAATER